MNLREFQNWALAQGQVGNPTPANSYVGECVSLVQQYLSKVFDMPFKARGNAKDWANNIPEGFEKLPASATYTKGDMLVYGANFGGGYGHIGIIDADGKWLEQNGKVKERISVSDAPYKGYICILRHIGGVNIGDEYQTGNYKTLYNMKVRNGVWGVQKLVKDLTTDGKKNATSTDLNSLAAYKTGTIFTALEIVNNTNDGSVWAKTPSGYVCIREMDKIYCEKI